MALGGIRVKGLPAEVERRLGQRAAGARVSRNRYLVLLLCEHVGLGEGLPAGPRKPTVTERLAKEWMLPGDPRLTRAQGGRRAARAAREGRTGVPLAGEPTSGAASQPSGPDSPPRAEGEGAR